ncbi:MAG: hypothetical protein UT00_C0010G0004 [Parcubacteria group bacterium GW2011_GWA1_38_7]|nr:MAG: hypothetical protein UT00_C0010G0004 [Parcubacteria group bacterium GW2011_GWA1_38_7]
MTTVKMSVSVDEEVHDRLKHHSIEVKETRSVSRWKGTETDVVPRRRFRSRD